jgi:beta-lactamase regulating signal transducer with metallopeptidase domain
MPPLPNLLLSNAIMAGLLALVAAGVTYFVRRPALSHGLWLLVLLKLLTPPIIPLQVSWPAKENTPVTADTQTSLESPGSSNDEPAGIPTSQPDDAVTTILIYPAEPESSNAESDSFVVAESNTPLPTNFWSYSCESVLALWPRLLAPIWLAGSILWLGWTGLHVYRFERVLRHAQPAPENLQNEVRDWAAQFGLRKCPTLWLVPGCVSPMLWTVGRFPRLLFPAKLLDRLDADQRSALLVHELAHLCRRDHWVRFVEMAAMAIYWWNPIVWWARRELHEAEEQCCDAWVVWALTLSGEPAFGRPGCVSAGEPVCGRPGCVSARRAYALALLHTVDFFSHARPTLPAPASGVGQVPHLRRRLTMIMNGNTPKSLSSAGRLAVLGLGLLLPLVPVQAQQPQDPKNDRDQQIEQLKKVLQALEQQKHAEREQQVAEERIIELRKKEADLQQMRAKEMIAGQQRQADEKMNRFKKDQLMQQAETEELRSKAVRFLQDAQLAQNAVREQRRTEVLRFNVDEKGDPKLQDVMRSIEEITRVIETKRQELRGLEEKLQHARVELERMRADGARTDAQRRIELKLDGAPAREPIILKIDPSANWDQVKKQVEEIQSKSRQPIRVEIVNPETGPVKRVEIVRPGPGPVNIRNRAEPAPAEVRARERRDARPGDLEERLEMIMKQVEELRRELHDSRNRKVN